MSAQVLIDRDELAILREYEKFTNAIFVAVGRDKDNPPEILEILNGVCDAMAGLCAASIVLKSVIGARST